MHFFRNLANSIFFKIFLAFIALSFVLWGVSDFVLSSPNSWVAKVGGKTISQNSFVREVEKNRDLISRANGSEEAMKYLNSERFQSDVLNRMVNQVIVEKISEDVGLRPSKNLILEEIAKNPQLKGQDGKFSHKAFQELLKQNGLDEAGYVQLAQHELAASIVSQTLTMVAPVNSDFAIAREEYKQQIRTADVITIAGKDVAKVATPNKEEVAAFFEENKAKYDAPEYREVSYIRFSVQDFAKNIVASDEEIKAQYEANKEKFFTPETRNIYHVLFDKQEQAQEFVSSLEKELAQKTKSTTAFLNVAKNLQQKSEKDITLNEIAKKDLLPELSNTIFQLEPNSHSQPIKSSLGYHVFLLNKINESSYMALKDVRDDIAKEIRENKEATIMQDNVGKIDDTILASNSLEKAVQEFSLQPVQSVTISSDGYDKKGQKPQDITNLENFVQNAFAAAKDESSKIFYSQADNQYYCLKVKEITPSHHRELDEVYAKVQQDLTAKLQAEKLQAFATQIADQVAKDPSKIKEIADKNHLKFEGNKDFPRTYYINYQGRQIPFANKFLGELFELEIGQASALNQQDQDEYSVAVLKKISTPKLDENQLNNAQLAEEQAFRQRIMQGYNAVMMQKYPVAVNQAIFNAN